MERPVLSVRGLTGGYSRKKPVLKDVSLEVRRGELVGLIGLNGAGKSTLMKHVIGLLKPHRGSVAVMGASLERSAEAYRASYAFVPESPSLYEELTVWEHLEWTALAYRLEEAEFRRRAEALLERFRMSGERDKIAGHLSKGMRQKVMIMCAFLVRPPLYVIDEPFLGLDPLAVRALLEAMRAEKEDGSALLVSSHILSILETYCDRYAVLHEGRIVARGTLAELAAAAGLPPEARLEDAFFRLVGSGDR